VRRFYNGVTLEDIHGPGYVEGRATKDAGTEVLGIQGMHFFHPFLSYLR
jgi:hypothetical protein